MSRRHRLNLAIITVFSAIGFLMYTGITNATVPYFSVSQLAAAGASLNGNQVQVEGRVDIDSVKWDPDELLLTFAILDDDGSRVDISYHGTRPDVFGKDIEAIVSGTFEDGHIAADQLLVRCPSKYKKADDTEFVPIEEFEPTDHESPGSSTDVEGSADTGY